MGQMRLLGSCLNFMVNKWTKRQYRIGTIGFVFQNISLAVVSPIYALVHLITSSDAKSFPSAHASTVLFIPPYDIAMAPVSTFLGFILPSFLMMYTGKSYALGSPIHQRLIAGWQFFPIYTVAIHYFLRRLYLVIAANPTISSRITIHKRNPSQPTITRSPAVRYLRSARLVYGLVLTFCIITHVSALVLAILPHHMLPDMYIDPTFVSLVGSTTFASVFLPPLPLPGHQAQDLTAGVHAFLQWDMYISATALLLWGSVLYRDTSLENERIESLPIHRIRSIIPGSATWQGWQRSSWQKLTVKVWGWSIVAGPFGALAVLFWERDEIVKEKIKQGV